MIAAPQSKEMTDAGLGNSGIDRVEKSAYFAHDGERNVLRGCSHDDVGNNETKFRPRGKFVLSLFLVK